MDSGLVGLHMKGMFRVSCLLSLGIRAAVHPWPARPPKMSKHHKIKDMINTGMSAHSSGM